MKLNNRWIKSASDFYVDANETIEDVGNNFDIRRFHSAEGYDVLLNNNTYRVLIQSHSNPINEARSDRKIHIEPDAKMKRGDLIRIVKYDEDWLVLSKVDRLLAYDSAQIFWCNHKLKWIDGDGNLVKKPAITSAQTLYTTGIKDEKVIEIPDGMQGVRLPYDEDTKRLVRGDNFVFNDSKYEITFSDRTTHPGLLTLICKEFQLGDNDDKVNEIADRWIDAQGGGKIDRLPWLDEQEPSEETEPTEPTEPNLGITYEIIGQPEFPSDPDDEIWYNSWTIYTVNKFIDDVEVAGNFTFELSDTKATLSDITTDLCKVNVGSISGDHIIKLIATDIDAGQIAIEKEITIRGR